MRGARSRVSAAAGLAVYVAASIVLPAAHLVGHADDHTHGPVNVDVASLVDERTGRVDLSRLAQALGLEDAQHADAHARDVPHEHSHDGDHGHSAPTGHGDGSFEHFAVALAAAARPPQAPAAVALEWPLTRSQPVEEVPSRLVFLDSQRAQAPPA